jgi:hypothetical protein
VPLVDTPITVIERSLSGYEAQTGQAGTIREHPVKLARWSSSGYRRTRPLIRGRRCSCWGSERMEFPGQKYNGYLGSMHSVMGIGQE